MWRQMTPRMSRWPRMVNQIRRMCLAMDDSHGHDVGFVEDGYIQDVSPADDTKEDGTEEETRRRTDSGRHRARS